MTESRDVQSPVSWPPAPPRRSLGWPFAALATACVVLGGAATAVIVAVQPSSSSSRRTLAAPREPRSSTTTPSPDLAVNQVIAIENVLNRDSGKAFAKFQRATTHLSDLGRIVASANPNAVDGESIRAQVREDVSDIADGVAGISSAYHVAATRLSATKFRTAKAKADAKVTRAKLAAVASEAYAIAAELPQSPTAMRMTLLLTQLGAATSTADAALGDLNHDLGLPHRLTIS